MDKVQDPLNQRVTPPSELFRIYNVAYAYPVVNSVSLNLCWAYTSYAELQWKYTSDVLFWISAGISTVLTEIFLRLPLSIHANHRKILYLGTIQLKGD
jgi:hypothetical protein